MKKYIKSSNDLKFEDDYLALEHAIDIASSEAIKLERKLYSQHRNQVGSSIEQIFMDLEIMKQTIRRCRVFETTYYEDTYETMMEDNSRYLED